MPFCDGLVMDEQDEESDDREVFFIEIWEGGLEM